MAENVADKTVRLEQLIGHLEELIDNHALSVPKCADIVGDHDTPAYSEIDAQLELTTTPNNTTMMCKNDNNKTNNFNNLMCKTSSPSSHLRGSDGPTVIRSASNSAGNYYAPPPSAASAVSAATPSSYTIPVRNSAGATTANGSKTRSGISSNSKAGAKPPVGKSVKAKGKAPLKKGA